MAEMVIVSLLHPHGYRASKDAEVIRYPRGLVEMPLEHAVAMDVTHRIRSVKRDAATGETTVTPLRFNGAFDDRLADTLTQAGYADLQALSRATQNELMALDGIGPAAYERIQNAVKGVTDGN